MSKAGKASAFLLVTLVFLFIPFSKKDPESGRWNLTDTLMNIDREFSGMSVSSGIKTAFTSYASDDVILMRQGHYPVTGINDLKEHYSNASDDGSILKWEPVKADVAASGEIGYTFGNWQYLVKTEDGKDTTFYGNYVTIWKKQPDGSWKFVLDGGTSTPPPPK
jgi:ketosteroid isomerase-like protein